MVRKKSPRSNDPYAKAKETINQNETAIKTILEQNSEPYLRVQSNLYKKFIEHTKMILILHLLTKLKKLKWVIIY